MLSRNFSVLIFSAVTSDVGSQAATFGLALYALDLSGAAAEFSMVLMAGALPLVLLSPFAGALSDRLDRKRLLIILDLIRAIFASILLFYLSLNLPVLPAVYLMAFVLAACDAFFTPAIASILPSIAARENVLKGNATLQGAKQFVLVTSPLIGGALYGFGGIEYVLGFTTAIYLVAIVIQIFFLSIPERGEGGSIRSLSLVALLQNFRAAGTYLSRSPSHLSLMMNGILSHLFLFPFIMVAVPYVVVKILGSSGTQLGSIQSSYAIGSLCAMPLTVLFQKKGTSVNLLIGLVGLLVPLAIYLLVLAPSLQNLLLQEPAIRVMLFSVAGFLLYFFFSYYVVYFLSFFQTEVPANMRGRAQALLVMNHGVARLIGFPLFGWLIDADYRLAFGLLSLGVLLKIAAHFPFMRRSQRSAPAFEESDG